MSSGTTFKNTPTTKPVPLCSTALPFWQPVLFAALAGGLGWGIRGQYGHETGAMIAGLLVGLVLALLFCPCAAPLPAARAVAWCTIAMGFGGSMTYAQTIGLTHDAPLIGNWAALRWGMLGLAIKGSLWIGFAGAFMGMGLSGVRYRSRELFIVMLGLLGLCAVGLWMLNQPFDPANKILPKIYFSADWRWQPGAQLKPRREVWGGLLFALAGLIAYTKWGRRDPLAPRLALWGVLGGAVGFPLGQCLQVCHAWNLQFFRTGFWAKIDPLINWWNFMETTFGTVMGAALGFGLWLNRNRIAPLREEALPSLTPSIEWIFVTAHIGLLVTVEFFSVAWVNRLYDFGLILGLIPIVAVAGGRLWPYLLMLPVTALPIAGKTLRQLVYRERAISLLSGWLLFVVLPLAITTIAAVIFARACAKEREARAFLRPTLLISTWLYFGLNYAFFHCPGPWSAWTSRTPNAIVFTLCAIGLNIAVWCTRPNREMKHRSIMPARNFIAAIILAFSVLAARAEAISRYTEPYPTATSKKGLQVEIVDDALALGVKHAALNFNLSQLVDPKENRQNPAFEFDGRNFYFERSYVEAMDHRIKALSDRGVLVNLIVLTYQSSSADVNRILIHPRCVTNAPNRLGNFNTATDEGRRWFTAIMEFCAERWSRPDQKYGRVAGYIIGNEVNSHWWWANMGRTTMKEFADDYLRTVRLAHTAIRKQSAWARIYLSLEHHWNIRYPAGDEKQCFPARPFLEYFAKRAREGGDFDWHIAFHPYPENLFEPRFWNDKSATTNVMTTPRITFKNIQLLPEYLRRPELLHKGKSRRVILSEQGFHTPKEANGEIIQAAAYCYAYKKIEALDGIDAFILHRHIDNRREGGLLLGLRSNQPANGEAQPKKKIYECFRAADTPEWKEEFEFALPIIGLKSWSEAAMSH